MPITRRQFLQSATAVTAAGLLQSDGLGQQAFSAASLDARRERSGSRLLAHVNPLQGTNSNFDFSRGNTLPIVALPFGMAHWTLQSHDESGWFFKPETNRFQGIRLTHQLSPWLGDYGYATFLPFTGESKPDPVERSTSYRPQELEISPARLSMFLMRYRCRLELVPTTRCCAMRFAFEDSKNAGLYIDLPGETAEATCNEAAGVVTALTHQNLGGVQANFATHFFIKFDRPIVSFTVRELKDRRVAEVRFATDGKNAVAVSVATSFISYEQAKTNLQNEVGSKPFEVLVSEAEDIWEKALSRVQVEGRTEQDHRTLYSCLYRTLLFPRVWHEQNAAGETVHMSPYTGRVEHGVMYADHGFWDDYHAWYPMMVLLYPERLREILQSWVNAYHEGGWIPQFPCPGYRGAMTGSPSDIIFAEAAAKGLGGFDLAAAYEGLRKQATQVVRGSGYGRTYLEPYLRLGYVPCDGDKGGVAETLDYTYGDFCISKIATLLGKTQDAEFFAKRSRNWRNIFDTQTRFFRGKLVSGAWKEPFDPFTWGAPYVEGAAWQYRFNVPYDPDGLMEAFGGKEALVRELEAMLNTPPRFNVGVYGAEIHEMAEMAAANFGQYAHSNQPVHNVLYLFTLAGRRDRTQHYVHRVLTELYSPDGFAGDEDTGSMSAWYILSALGIFPACPGDSKWTFGAPFFDSMRVKLGEDATLEVNAQRPDKAAFFNQVSLNGKPTDGVAVEHKDLVNSRILFRAT